MKLIHRYLLCLMALLLLFSSYCKSGESIVTSVKPLTHPDIDSPVGQRLLFADPLHVINLCISNRVMLNLPDSHPFQNRSKIYHDPPTFQRIFFNLSESLPPFADKRSSIDLWAEVLRSPKYAFQYGPLKYTFQYGPLIYENHLKNYQVPNLNATIIYKEKKDRTGFGRGAAIGAIVGAGIGFIAGFAYQEPSGQNFISNGAGALMGAVAGAIVGIIIGGIIGALTKKRT